MQPYSLNSHASQPTPSPSHFFPRAILGGTILASGAFSVPASARICVCVAFCGNSRALAGNGAVPAITYNMQNESQILLNKIL